MKNLMIKNGCSGLSLWTMIPPQNGCIASIEESVIGHIVKEKPEAVLLIVDDERTVCRALSRLLDREVKEILSATNPGEAEIVLRSGRVTHVICDHWFGPGQPVGIDLVKRWRREFPSIRKAIVLTGTDINKLKGGKAVDKILPKVVDPDELIKILDLSTNDDENENCKTDDDENGDGKEDTLETDRGRGPSETE